MQPAGDTGRRAACLAASLLSGLLLVLCFPRPDLGFLAPIALVPLLLASLAERQRLWLFLYGELAGVVFLAGTMPWIYSVLRTYGRLSASLAAGVFVLFVVGFAFFFGLYTWWVGELARRSRTLALWLAPAIWVAMEFFRTHLFFGGLPWNLLGYALVSHPALIQVASLTGIYGVSFFLAVINTALAAAAGLRTRPARLWALGVSVVVGVLVGVQAQVPDASQTSTALLVQTNLPQLTAYEPDWAGIHQQELTELYRLTAQGVGEPVRPTLVVWPEVPAPLYFHRDPLLRAQWMSLAQSAQSYLLAGIVDYRRGSDGLDRPHNTAILLAPTGEFVGQYDKIHLVPFGEYLPWRQLGRVLSRLVAEVSDFAPGIGPALLPAGESRLGVVICYEAIFPGLVRAGVARGADVLVNISNDGWFGQSAAAAQHLAMARMRAVETRRFLLRATNTGITAVIDPYGRLLAQAPRDTRTVLRAGFAPRQERTLYLRWGDWFAWLCLVLGLAGLGRTMWQSAVEARTYADDRRTGTAL